MDYRFEVVNTPAQPALVVRTVTSVTNLPQELGRVFQKIIAYLEGLGERPANAAFAAYYNMDMERLDVEIGFPVRRALPGSGEILPTEIPAGRKASCIYKGPYREMASVYQAMAAWMAENGLHPAGTVYEFYYNSPMDVPESDLLTRIDFVLK